VLQRIGPGISAMAAGPADRIVGSRGAGGSSPRSRQSPGWAAWSSGGQRCVLLVRGPHVLPSGRRLLCSPHSHPPHPRSARASWTAENGRSLAAYLARYGEHGSHRRGL